MVESREFRPVKEFGNISVSDDREIKFYVDEYKGYTYASVRTFLKREGYSGPTKAGITMNPNLLGSVIETLSKLTPEPSTTEDQELARYPKKAGIEFVVRITIHKDTTGIDLREWVNDGSYEGWSKKGIRIPYQYLAKTIDYMKQMGEFLKQPKGKA
ncbi:MAG: hypothetical protein HY059_22575 [Proteobacteria bacterium]|nr:hypothetical protein [Pseudomonadota bacterium]